MGHTVSVELATGSHAMIEAAEMFRPDLILCPFLKERIPEAVWKHHVCLVVHPGIEGDRGPSSLDWAVSTNASEWGVTLLQATGEMDAGDIWGTRNFPMREASKASLYRHDVTAAAMVLIRRAVANARNADYRPRPLDYSNPNVKGALMPAMRQEYRRIDWRRDTTARVLRRINAADSCPGVLDEILGEPAYLYGARREPGLTGEPGAIIARSDGAFCRATVDGAVWIRAARRCKGPENRRIKLPASRVLDDIAAGRKQRPDVPVVDSRACREIDWYEQNGVAYLRFDFYNGAMNTDHCRRLRQELRRIKKRRSVKVIVLMGGEDFWSNGIHLNCIEAADNAAEESWRNINAMDDLVEEIILSTRHLTVAALGANAGAGGAILPLACDRVVARRGVVLNPHYATMSLYGSEYWTYLLPRRVAEANARRIMDNCMPLLAEEAAAVGMVDELFVEDRERYDQAIVAYCEDLARSRSYRKLLVHKQKQRKMDEKRRPLALYRKEELLQMRKDFFDAASGYHVARKRFVHKLRPAETPLRLALHRQEAFEPVETPMPADYTLATARA